MGDLLAAWILAMTLLGGCGFITQGTHPTIPVRSDPPGAAVYVDGTLVGVTPLRLGIAGHTPRRIDVIAEGHARQSYLLEHRVDEAFVVLDIIGFWGLLIDGATGGWVSPAVDEIYARLLPLAAGVPSQGAPGPGAHPVPIRAPPSGVEAGSRLSVPPGYH